MDRSMDSQYKRHTEVAFSLKIGISAIPTSPVKLQSFFMPSDYCVVLLWWRFFGTLVFDRGYYDIAWTGAWTANK